VSHSPVRGVATGLRRIIGAVIAVFGVILGLSVAAFAAIVMLGYWDYENAEGRAVLVLMVVLALLVGYGIYKLGRRIAR
jgi:hypothetical protein